MADAEPIDADLKRRVDALRRPLELAAADNFAGVTRVKGLGHVLRIACDQIIAKVELDGLATWRAMLDRWEHLDETQQAVEVARGMRLLARIPRPAGASIMRQLSGEAPAPVDRNTSWRRGNAAVTSQVALASSRPDGVPAERSKAERNVAERSKAERNPAQRSKAERSVPAERSKAERNVAAETKPDRNLPAETPQPVAASKRPRNGSQASTSREDRNIPAKPSQAGSTSRTHRNIPEETSLVADTSSRGDRNADVKRGRRAAPEPVGDPLAQPTYTLPGIGPAFAERLAEKGLVTVEDLLWTLPRRYDDVRDARPLADVLRANEGERITFVAAVASSRMVFVRGRRWGEVRLVGEGATVVVRWFNIFAGIDKRMPAGSRVVLSGVVKKREGRVEFANPDVLGVIVDEPSPQRPSPQRPSPQRPSPSSPSTTPSTTSPSSSSPSTTSPSSPSSPSTTPSTTPSSSSPSSTSTSSRALPSILARYPDVPGVPGARLRQACIIACERVGGSVDDGVPKCVEAAARLPSLAETLSRLHCPAPDIAVDELAAMNRGDSRWQRRLAFGELFALGVAIGMRRRERRSDAAVPCPIVAGFDEVIAKALPFEPTRAQRRAIGELAMDLARDVPMNRLLQGDVGAGKTAVAFAAALQVATAGRQTAVMAPTELLAEQHFQTWRAWAASAGLRIELLTASTPKGVKATLVAMMAAGARAGDARVDVVIGTHALLAESVGFGALGLVVIDEQHRFGVAQRSKLRDKGDGQGAPHLLVMTATPIPRTLALTAYGDLDVSVLDELPPGRKPVSTKLLVGARGRAAAYKLVGERVAAGERAYVVCPKIEPSDDDELDEVRGKRTWRDAVSTAEEVAAALPAARVGLVHGRLDGSERDRVMRAFKAGELDVLVATTVIEVGVDVPAATVMVIHDAERFGLAQLHQLRGRVGRGSAAAHCVLLAQGGLGEDSERRLAALVATDDGFRIAEEDLVLRGPGEVFGPRQAGIPRLRFGDLQQHTQLLLEAREHAERVLAEDPELARPQHVSLRAAVVRRLAHHVYGSDSG